MTSRLDDKIRAFVLELVDDPPPAPEIDVEAMDRPVRRPLRQMSPQRRASVPAFAVAGAALLVLIAVGLPILLFGSGDSTVVDQATTLPPTTEAPATTVTTATTIGPATTTVPVVVPPLDTTWERIADEAFSPGAIWAIASSGDVVVAVGEVLDLTDVGSITGPAPDGVVWASVDGQEWERIDDPAVFAGDGAQFLADVVAGRIGFMAGGQDGAQAALWFSPDGYEWEKVLVDDLGNPGEITHFAVAATDPGWVAIEDDDDPGDFVFISRDGFEWERIEDPSAASGYVDAVAASNPLPLTVPPLLGVFWDFAWEGERVIAVCRFNGVSIWLSEDSGATWHRVDPEQEVFYYGWPLPQSLGVTLFGSGIIVGGNSADGAAIWIGQWEDKP